MKCLNLLRAGSERGVRQGRPDVDVEGLLLVVADEVDRPIKGGFRHKEGILIPTLCPDLLSGAAGHG